MKIILISLFILLSSCTVIDVDYHLPHTSFEGPETTGGELFTEKATPHMRFHGRAGTTHKFTLGEVYDAFIFGDALNKDAQYERSATASAQFDAGLASRFDLGVKKTLDAPFMFGGKFQFLGESEAERKRGPSMGVFAYYANSSKDEGSLAVSANAGSQRTYTAELEMKGMQLGISGGFRFNQHILAYVTAHHLFLKTESILKSSTFPDVTIVGTSRVSAGQFGLKWSNDAGKFFIQSEAGISQARFENEIKVTNFGWAGGFGLYY
jgi:hypothetical protein